MDGALEAHPYVMNMESAEALAWELDHAAAQLSPVLRERMEWAPAAAGEAGRGPAAFAEARPPSPTRWPPSMPS